jgi:hypothetical protein
MISFPYDVAISFLAEDHGLAREIEAALPNLKGFVYSERQAEIGATDGVETFPNVFGRDARIVVVLYREKWGTTKWTRIEEIAIKNRLLNDGAEFLTFIHLEPGKPTPRWLPQTRLWVDLARLGVVGAVSVIEERVRQAGGAVREETAEENATRLGRERRAEAERLGFLRSDDGVRAADQSADQLLTAVDDLAQRTGASVARMNGGTDRSVAVYRDGYSVEVLWRRPFSNTLDTSLLAIVEWQGRLNFGAVRTQKLKELESHLFDFDVEQDEELWRDRQTKRLFSPDRLVEFAVKLLLERVRKTVTR